MSTTLQLFSVNVEIKQPCNDMNTGMTIYFIMAVPDHGKINYYISVWHTLDYKLTSKTLK